MIIDNLLLIIVFSSRFCREEITQPFSGHGSHVLKGELYWLAWLIYLCPSNAI